MTKRIPKDQLKNRPSFIPHFVECDSGHQLILFCDRLTCPLCETVRYTENVSKRLADMIAITKHMTTMMTAKGR